MYPNATLATCIPPGRESAQTVNMRVLLKLTLDCTPDAAWRALRNPLVFRQVAAPLLSVVFLEPGGFPESFPVGDHRVRVSSFGVLPMGEQLIRLAFTRRGDARLLRDTGRPTSGLLSVITAWEHAMAVSPLPDGRTLYRDQLRFDAGVLTPLLWPVLWAVWQWRALQIRRVSREWR